MTKKHDLPKASAELEHLAGRLQAQREQAEREAQARRTATEAMGGGFRIAVDMLAALAVGTGLGYMADRMFGTMPWIMVAGIFFGFAAGVRNMIRSARRMDAQRSGSDDETG